MPAAAGAEPLWSQEEGAPNYSILDRLEQEAGALRSPTDGTPFHAFPRQALLLFLFLFLFFLLFLLFCVSLFSFLLLFLFFLFFAFLLSLFSFSFLFLFFERQPMPPGKLHFKLVYPDYPRKTWP